MAFFENVPKVTKNLLIINVIVFIATKLRPEMMYSMFALFPFPSHGFHIWQLFTYMYMHAGIWHIFFNMYTLLMFGCVVENVIGSKKFFTMYTLCGLGAAALHGAIGMFTNSYIPTVGASGAIYGVLIAYAMLFPDSRMTLLFPPVTLTAKWMVGVFIGIELLTGVTGTMDGVAHFAHLGGAVVGYLMVLVWRKTNRLFDRDIWI